jgi:hypothetical protein
MRPLAPVGLLALALSACQSGLSSTNAALAQAAPQVAQSCADLQVTLVGVELLASKPKLVQAASQAQSVVQALCAAPPRDVPSALSATANALRALQAAKAAP